MNTEKKTECHKRLMKTLCCRALRLEKSGINSCGDNLNWRLA